MVRLSIPPHSDRLAVTVEEVVKKLTVNKVTGSGGLSESSAINREVGRMLSIPGVYVSDNNDLKVSTRSLEPKCDLR